MKKPLLLSLILLQSLAQAFDDNEGYTFGSGTPEINFVNAAKSYAIKVAYEQDDAGQFEILRPLGRSGSIELPTGVEDSKLKAILTLTAYDSYGDALKDQNALDTKKFKVTFDSEFGKAIRATQAPAIILNYSKGYFGDAGFSLKGNTLINGFAATEISGDTSSMQD